MSPTAGFYMVLELALRLMPCQCVIDHLIRTDENLQRSLYPIEWTAISHEISYQVILTTVNRLINKSVECCLSHPRDIRLLIREHSGHETISMSHHL
jgi:hypothetical protein